MENCPSANLPRSASNFWAMLSIAKVSRWIPKRSRQLQIVTNNLTELRRFLGLCSYYQRFVERFAKLAAPLTYLLRKNRLFIWNEEATTATDNLKLLLTTAPVLAIPNPVKDWVIVDDASSKALGGILLQDHGHGLQPMAYESRKLNPVEQNYAVHEKETLAIIHALKVWRCYVQVVH